MVSFGRSVEQLGSAVEGVQGEHKEDIEEYGYKVDEFSSSTSVAGTGEYDEESESKDGTTFTYTALMISQQRLVIWLKILLVVVLVSEYVGLRLITN